MIKALHGLTNNNDNTNTHTLHPPLSVVKHTGPSSSWHGNASLHMPVPMATSNTGSSSTSSEWACVVESSKFNTHSCGCGEGVLLAISSHFRRASLSPSLNAPGSSSPLGPRRRTREGVWLADNEGVWSYFHLVCEG